MGTRESIGFNGDLASMTFAWDDVSLQITTLTARNDTSKPMFVAIFRTSNGSQVFQGTVLPKGQTGNGTTTFSPGVFDLTSLNLHMTPNSEGGFDAPYFMNGRYPA